MDFFERLQRGLKATRSRFGEYLPRGTGEVTAETLEEALLAADVGLETAEAIASDLAKASAREIGLAGGVSLWLRERLRQQLVATLLPPRRGVPHVVLVVGVNGTGKTTTVAKLAAAAKAEGRQVMAVAGDTFRAAAVEQLQRWGQRLDFHVVASTKGTDPAAVVFDGIQLAVTRKVDEVIVDTAGRLHTRHNLMGELEKIRRVCGKALPGAPHEVLLTLDATTGSNGLAQAREFGEHAGLTGVVLTKLDGTAKGGVVLAVAGQLGVPVRWVGVGEGADDLLAFDPDAFARALTEGLG